MFIKFFTCLIVVLSFLQVFPALALKSEDDLFGFSNSLIYGIIQVAQNSKSAGLNEQCFEDLTTIQLGFQKKKSWAIKLVDSSGKPNAGFVLGNNHWLGVPHECNYVNEPMKLSLSSRINRSSKPDLLTSSAPFEVEFRMIYIKHSSPWQIQMKFMTEHILHLGLCLPKSCNNHQIHELAEIYFNSKDSILKLTYNSFGKILLVKKLKLRENFWQKKSCIIFCTCISMITILTYLASKRKREGETNNFGGKILESFSYGRNLKIIECREHQIGSIPVINGMKTLCCTIIFISHISWYSYFTMPFPTDLLLAIEKSEIQLFNNSALLVDVFFAISGFLVVYNFLNNSKRMQEISDNGFKKNVNLFGKLLLHRYLRLTPILIVMILLAEISTTVLADTSLFWIQEPNHVNCGRYWWRNLLYIQNLFEAKDCCLTHTWSLACEMQFFILATIVLIVYAKNKIAGTKLFLALSLGVSFIGVFLHFYHKLELSLDVMTLLGDKLYTTPWARICSYLVGTLTGWFLHEQNGKLLISKNQTNICWTIAALIFTFFMLNSPNRQMPFYWSSLLKISAHIGVAISFSWVIIADVSGHHNYITRFLSKKIFVKLSRTTYAIYLISPIFSNIFVGLSKTGLEIQSPMIIIISCGFVYLTEIIAKQFTLFFEMPFCNLLTMWQKHKQPTETKAE